MGNTTKGLQEDFNEIISLPRAMDHEDLKPASKAKQGAFDLLNYHQDKKSYGKMVKAVQQALRDA